MSDMQSIGRLVMRVEGRSWNAYYALPDTMDGAVYLGTIRMAAVTGNLERKQAFADLMRGVVSEFHEKIFGERPSFDSPKRLPERERVGHT